jgi:hypothetical protein
MIPDFAPPFEKVSHRPTGANLLKKKWVPAWSRCCAHTNAYPLDANAADLRRAGDHLTGRYPHYRQPQLSRLHCNSF